MLSSTAMSLGTLIVSLVPSYLTLTLWCSFVPKVGPSRTLSLFFRHLLPMSILHSPHHHIVFLTGMWHLCHHFPFTFPTAVFLSMHRSSDAEVFSGLQMAEFIFPVFCTIWPGLPSSIRICLISSLLWSPASHSSCTLLPSPKPPSFSFSGLPMILF